MARDSGKRRTWFDTWIPGATLLVAGAIVLLLALDHLFCGHIGAPGWLVMAIDRTLLTAVYASWGVGAIEAGLVSSCARAHTRGERSPFSFRRHALAFAALFAAIWLAVAFGSKCGTLLMHPRR